MNDISYILEQGENERVEFKTSFQKEVIETVVAFSNLRGGKIFIGINDERNIVGIDIAEETFAHWINTIKQNTQPSVIVDIQEVNIENKTIAIIDVNEYPIKPIAYKNRFYKRVKNSNHLMSLNEIANAHLKTINSSWDYQMDTRHDFDDVSIDKALTFVKNIERFQQKSFDDDIYTVLTKYELIKNGNITFATYLLFTNNISSLTCMQLGRFKTETDIIDSLTLNCDLPTQIKETIDFVRKHLMVEYIITGNPQREERYDYPLEAIREVVVNMIVHRDYTEVGDSVIKIFDDRIEFFNPGKLYADLTIEQLEQGIYSSQTRNKAIAKMFKETGTIEKYGSGIKRIKQACKKHGIKLPVFEEFSNGFKVTLFKEKINGGIKEEINQDGGINGGIKEEINQDGGINGGIKEDANQDGGIKKLEVFIKKNSNLKARELSVSLSVSLRTIQRWLKQLKTEGKIEYKGSKKTGGYFTRE